MTLALQVGYAERCFQDLPPCGDGMTCMQEPQSLRLMLADGIGHGAHAHRVVTQLSERFQWIYGRSSSLNSIADCMRELHGLLRGQQQTDQAAVAMLEVDAHTGRIAALSVGNVRVHSVGAAGCFSFPCLNGMVGGHLPRQLPLTVRQAQQPSLLVLHSDGLSSKAVVAWLENLQGRFGPATGGSAQPMADALLLHCAKRSDDAACAVVVIHEAPA
jgi:Stage II sporulation protein E (SpoIIE)